MRRSLNHALAVPALTIALLAGGSAIGALTGGSDHRPPTITEDHPDWDCTTMGNKVCGVTEEQRAIAWRAWDSQEGWRSITVNPDLYHRVEVTGWSLTAPKVEGLTLLGDDGRWYVYTVTYTQP